MRKIIGIFLITVMLFSLFTACGGQKKDNTSSNSTAADQSAIKEEVKNEQTQPVTLKAMFWAQETKEQFAKLSDDYNKLNTNIKIEWEYPPNSDYKKILSVRLLSGEAPDIFGSIDSSFRKYCRPMEDQPWRSRVISGSNLSMKGQLMGIPLTYTGLLAYYNKKVFSDAGITEIPETWEDFLKLCDTFKSKNITPIAFGMKDSFVHNTIIAQMEQGFLSTITDQFFEDLYFGKDKFANHPEFEKGMEKYLQLYKKGYFPEGCIGLDYNSVFTMFANGKAAMCLHGSWLPGFVWDINKDCDIGVFAFPDGNGASSVVACNDWNLACSKVTKNEKQVLDFFNFIAKKENLAYLSEEWQQLPTFNDVDPELKPVMIDTMNLVKQIKSSDCFYIDVPDPNYELNKICMEMFVGNKTTKEAVDAFDQVCQQYRDCKKALYEDNE